MITSTELTLDSVIPYAFKLENGGKPKAYEYSLNGMFNKHRKSALTYRDYVDIKDLFDQVDQHYSDGPKSKMNTRKGVFNALRELFKLLEVKEIELYGDQYLSIKTSLDELYHEQQQKLKEFCEQRLPQAPPSLLQKDFQDYIKEKKRHHRKVWKKGSGELYDLQHYLIVSLYGLFTLRNDYYKLKFRNYSETENYIEERPDGMYLNIHDFKTDVISKLHIDSKLPDDLARDLRIYIESRAQKEGDYVFVKQNSCVPYTTSQWSLYLQKDVFGGCIGSRALRQMCVTSMNRGLVATEELERRANSMQHSLTTHLTTYRPNYNVKLRK